MGLDSEFFLQVLIPVTVAFTLIAFASASLVKSDDKDLTLPAWPWFAIILFVPFLGPIAFFVWGRLPEPKYGHRPPRRD